MAAEAALEVLLTFRDSDTGYAKMLTLVLVAPGMIRSNAQGAAASSGAAGGMMPGMGGMMPGMAGGSAGGMGGLEGPFDGGGPSSEGDRADRAKRFRGVAHGIGGVGRQLEYARRVADGTSADVERP